MHVSPEIRQLLLLRIRYGRKRGTFPLRPRAAMPVRIPSLFSQASKESAMTRHPELPELLERYMEDSGRSEQWITVQEIRTYFHLAESDGPALSGFLSKIHHGPFVSCRYRVARMEKFRATVPPYRIIKKYLVCERPVQRDPPILPVKESLRSAR